MVRIQVWTIYFHLQIYNYYDLFTNTVIMININIMSLCVQGLLQFQKINFKLFSLVDSNIRPDFVIIKGQFGGLVLEYSSIWLIKKNNIITCAQFTTVPKDRLPFILLTNSDRRLDSAIVKDLQRKLVLQYQSKMSQLEQQ